jgi:hypothetical protein
MKVYIVEYFMLHEGGEIKAVFSSKDEADEYVFQRIPTKGQWYDITEWEVIDLEGQ